MDGYLVIIVLVLVCIIAMLIVQWRGAQSVVGGSMLLAGQALAGVPLTSHVSAGAPGTPGAPGARVKVVQIPLTLKEVRAILDSDDWPAPEAASADGNITTYDRHLAIEDGQVQPIVVTLCIPAPGLGTPEVASLLAVDIVSVMQQAHRSGAQWLLVQDFETNGSKRFAMRKALDGKKAFDKVTVADYIRAIATSKTTDDVVTNLGQLGIELMWSSAAETDGSFQPGSQIHAQLHAIDGDGDGDGDVKVADGAIETAGAVAAFAAAEEPLAVHTGGMLGGAFKYAKRA